MRIEQKQTSTMVADNGKVFRRKTDGYIMGETITLGYDYYDADVPLSAPHATSAEDYEEIETPQDWQKADVIRQVQRLLRTDEIIKANIAEMNSLELSASDALKVAHWYPTLLVTEGYREGETIAQGARVQYAYRLYEALQTHTITIAFAPSIHTASLWCEVVEPSAEVGTLDNPIPYEGNMVLEMGKYYAQEGVVYLCVRDSGAPLYNPLRDLVGIYVSVVE